MLDFIPYGLGVAVALLTILELVFAPVLLLYFCWSVLRSLRRIADSMESQVPKLYPIDE